MANPTPNSRRMGRAVLAWLFAVTLSSAPLYASPNKEYLVKAAFIYNFTKLVNWPSNPDTLNLCFEGDKDYAESLKEIEQRSNARLRYKVYQPPIADIPCHIAIEDMAQTLALFGKTGVLTVGSEQEFIAKGGIVAFIKVGERVKFLINLSKAEEAGLRINPQLLEVAHKVIR